MAMRIAWGIAAHSRQPQVDEKYYVGHAVRLAEGRGYVDENGRPAMYWPAGYPIVLAAGYKLMGGNKLSGPLLQGVFGVALCVLVWLVGRMEFSETVGRLAALVLAVYPNHVFFTTLHLTEPLFAVLVLGAVALLLLQRTATTAVAGVLLGLAALTRPVILLFPGALIIWYWLRNLRPDAALVRAVLVGCCMLATVSPWLVRNHGLTGRWTVLSTAGGHNFWIGNHRGAFGGYQRPPELSLRRLGEGYDYSRGYRLGLATIRDQPVRAAVRALQKLTYFFALETDGLLWNLKGFPHPPPLTMTLALLAAANIAYLVVLAFAVLGVICTPGKHPLASLFLLLTSYLVLIATVFFGDPRYHYVLVPLAAIFAAKALVEDWPRLVSDWKEEQPAARRRGLQWAAAMSLFGLMMATNVVLKILESRTQ